MQTLIAVLLVIAFDLSPLWLVAIALVWFGQLIRSMAREQRTADKRVEPTHNGS